MKNKILITVGIFIGVCLLGLFFWLLFAAGSPDDNQLWQSLYAIVSLSFIALVPFVMGGLTAYLGCLFHKRTWFWIYLAPSLFVAAAMCLSLILSLEAIFCVILAAPVMLPFSFVGGLLGAWCHSLGQGRLYTSILVFLPLLTAPLESLWQHPHQVIEVPSQVLIDASPEAVWSQIVSVPAIAPAELPSSWIYWLEFPRPIAAEIDRPGIGGTRWATFEREVSFFEVVTHWDENQLLAFQIKADPDFIPHTAFDQHIVVGGRFFDVLDGRYELEAYGNKTLLHLHSRHQLATPFNAYAGWWSKHIMYEIQDSILQVIKNRAEAQQSSNTKLANLSL